jgi:pimeloyl-ACP methyl ester carboxylesterase
MSHEITPIQIKISDEDLADLRRRLGQTRWPEPSTVPHWTQGVPLAYLQQLCRYWADDYDSAARQTRLNSFDQYRTEIDGLGIHFLHVRSPEPDALPLILSHGWPGSMVEFMEVIGPLTNPGGYGGDAGDAFHIVAPSLPGYGWSDKPTAPGWGIERIADAWVALMARLGYDRYGAQGGDWGAGITPRLGQAHPEHVAGIHLDLVVAQPQPGQTEFTDEERASLAAMTHYMQSESGYCQQQATRPQTLGYGLRDSPAGQWASILEKFCAWSDCDGDPVALWSRPDPGQCHPVLVAQDRGVFGPPLLAELCRPGGRTRNGRRPRRSLHIPQGDLPHTAALGVPDLYRSASLEATRPRWALRRLRTARAVRQ